MYAKPNGKGGRGEASTAAVSWVRWSATLGHVYVALRPSMAAIDRRSLRFCGPRRHRCAICLTQTETYVQEVAESRVDSGSASTSEEKRGKEEGGIEEKKKGNKGAISASGRVHLNFHARASNDLPSLPLLPRARENRVAVRHDHKLNPFRHYLACRPAL